MTTQTMPARTARRRLAEVTDAAQALLDTLGPLLETYPQGVRARAEWAERVHDALTTAKE